MTIDLSALQVDVSAMQVGQTPSAAPISRLLFLNNPGRMSRYFLEGLIAAADGLGIEYRVCELGAVWSRRASDMAGVTREMAEMVRRERITAVLGYTMNGAADFECRCRSDGTPMSLFEALGVKHLMFWSDHPQWASNKTALLPDLQPLLRSANNYHFLKCESAAREIDRVLGWLNCHGLPVGEDPKMVRPQPHIEAEFDLVSIVGTSPQLEPWILPFLDQKNPDIDAINGIVAGLVREGLSDVWLRDVPEPMLASLVKMGDDWVERRRVDGRTASFRHLEALTRDHGDAVQWLLGHPQTYFDAVDQLWLFGRWQRPFYLSFLPKYFRVAVFGSDWSSAGCAGGDWVDHHHQAEAYARGQVAFSVSQATDEEGIAHKPFEMAASGVPFVHNHARGLSDYFTLGSEVGVFDTPSDACDLISDLIRDPARRAEMGRAARARFEQDHTWANRLERMLMAAGLPVATFRASSTPVVRSPVHA